MKRLMLGLGAVLSGIAWADATVTTEGTELTINVPNGESYTYAEAVSGLTKIVKTGGGACAFAPSSVSFTGTIDVQAGTLHGDRAKFGTPAAWKVTPGAALRFDQATDGYVPGETGKPSGTLEIGGLGCDGFPAFYYTMLPNGTSAGQYSTSHKDFNNGVTLTADTSVGGGRFGFAAMNMQGHDLYLYCTNGQAVYEMYYPMTNLGDIYIKKGGVLIERDTEPVLSPITNQCYVMANGTTIKLYNHYARADRPSAMGIRLEDNATAQLTLTGGGAISADRNTWLGDWHLGKGKQLTLYADSLVRCGTMKGSIDGSAILSKKGAGPYTITSDGTHEFAQLEVIQGTLSLGANQDGSAYPITNIWKVASGSQYADVARLNLGANARTFSTNVAQILNKAGKKEGVVSSMAIRAGYAGAEGAKSWGVVTVGDGAVISNNFLLGCNAAGGTTGRAIGAVYMDNATVHWRAGGGNDGFIGQNEAGYGYWCQNGGLFTHHGYINMGAVGSGCIDQRGGVHRILSSDPLKFARTGWWSWGCYHQTGGTFEGKTAWFNYNYVTNCSSAVSVLTTTGPNSLFSCESMQAHMSRKTVDTIINVNDGAILQGRLYREISMSGYNAGQHWATWSPQMTNTTHVYLNINGGILKNKSNLSTDLWGADRMRGPTRVTIYEKGATFDTSEKDIVLNTELVKPFGKGLKSFSPELSRSWVTNYNEFIASPRIRISSDTGSGASAYAVFNEKTRRIDRIDITSPGCGYEDLTIIIDNGQMNQTTNLSGNVVFETLSTTGGVRKVGAGTLTLACANTYGGVTRVEGGSIAFTHANGLPQGSALEFAASAVAGGAKNTPLLTAVNYNGGEIRITEAETLDAETFGRSRVLATFANVPATTPTLRLIRSDGTELAGNDWKVFLSSEGKLRFGRNIGLAILIR